MNKRKMPFLFSHIKYSIFIISICTLLMGALSYSQIRNEVISNAKETNNKLLFQYRNTVDNLFISDFDKMSQMLLEEVKSKSDLKYYIDNPLKGNVVDTLKVSDYLNTFKNLNSLAYSVAVYYEKNKLLVSSDYIKYSNDDGIEDQILLYYHKMLETMKQEGMRYDFTLDRGENMFGDRSFSGRSYPENVINIVRTFPESSGNTVVVVISADAAVLQGVIQKYAPDNMESIIVIDEANQIISHSDSKYIGRTAAEYDYLKTILSSDMESGNITSEVDGMPMVLTYQTSQLNGWKYVAFTPIPRVHAVAQNLFKTIISVALLTLVLGAIISLFAAKYFSKPLRQIALRCNRMPYAAGTRIKNEYSLINKTLDDLSEIMAMKEIEFQEISPMLMNNFVSWLLSNKVTEPDEIKKKMRALKIEFAYEKFCVIAVEIKRNQSDDENDGYEYEKTRTMALLEKYVDTELTSGAVYDDGNALYIFINYGCSEEILPELFMSAITGDSGSYTCYLAMGPSIDDISGAVYSCRKAAAGLGYSYLYPEKHVFTAIELEEYENNSFTNELLLNNIVNSLKCENYYKINSDFDFIMEFLYQKKCSLDSVKKILLPISSALNEFIYGKNNRNPMLENPMGCFSNIKEFSDKVKNLLAEKYEKSTAKGGDKEGDIIDDAKRYISENLMDPQLSLEAVAKHLNISANYLSRYFHNECNITFVGYISSLKMQHGRKLLLETSMKIEEISKELGYSSPQYFISKFKKQFGETPNTYRLRLCGQDDNKDDHQKNTVV